MGPFEMSSWWIDIPSLEKKHEPSKMDSLTVPVDTFYEILDYLSHGDLVQLCQRFPDVMAFCHDSNFWRRRVKHRFDITTKPNDLTWNQVDSLLDEDVIRPIQVIVVYPDGYERPLGELWVQRDESINSLLERLEHRLQRRIPVTVEAYTEADGEPLVTSWDLEPSDVPLDEIRLDSHDYLWDSDFRLILQAPMSSGHADGVSSLESLSEMSWLPSSNTFESAHTTLNQAENVITQLHQLGASAEPLISSLTSGIKSLGSGIRSFLPSKNKSAMTIPNPSLDQSTQSSQLT
jgi:hypothetical protein